jgi:hypothetical protein
MALNMQIFQQLRKQANRQTKQGKTNSSEKTATLLNLVHKLKEISEQPSQSHYNSHFNFNKQAYAQYEGTLQKEQRMPRANLWSYHPYLMKALIKNNKTQQKNNTTSITRNEEDPPYQNHGDSSNFRR